MSNDDKKPLSHNLLSQLGDPNDRADYAAVAGRIRAAAGQSAQPVHCENCRYFRRNGLPSSRVRAETLGEQTNGILNKLREAETQAIGTEASQRLQLLDMAGQSQVGPDTEDPAWMRRPLVSAYCGIAEREPTPRYLVWEYKNRGNRCPDFMPASGVVWSCMNCSNLREARGPDFSKSHEFSVTLWSEPLGEGRLKLLEQERRRKDLEAAGELSQAVYSQGFTSSGSIWFDTCDAIYSATGTALCAFLNADDQCPHHSGRSHERPPEATPIRTAPDDVLSAPPTGRPLASRSLLDQLGALEAASSSQPGRTSTGLASSSLLAQLSPPTSSPATPSATETGASAPAAATPDAPLTVPDVEAVRTAHRRKRPQPDKDARRNPGETIKIDFSLEIGDRIRVVEEESTHGPSHDTSAIGHRRPPGLSSMAAGGSEGDQVGRTTLVQRIDQKSGEKIYLSGSDLKLPYGIFGLSGEGKTNFIKLAVDDLLRYRADVWDDRFGGLILDPKGVIREDIEEVFDRRGRKDDLIVIDISEMQRTGVATNLLDVNMPPEDLAETLFIALQQNARFQTEEPFWQNEVRALVASVVMLKHILGEPITISDIGRTITDYVPASEGPKEAEADPEKTDAKKPKGKPLRTPPPPKPKRELEALIERAEARASSKAEGEDEDARDEISRHVSQLRTRLQNTRNLPTILQTASNAFEPFQARRYRKLFSATGENADPRYRRLYERPINDGTVVLVSVSQEHLLIARSLSVMIKGFFFNAMLSRRQRYMADTGIDNFSRPLFFIADEYSECASETGALGDSKFFKLVRQNACFSLIATQSIPTLREAFAGAPGDPTEVILSTLAGMLFFRIADPVTAEQTRELIGQRRMMVTKRTTTRETNKVSFAEASEIVEEPLLPPQLLNRLKPGMAVATGQAFSRNIGDPDVLVVQTSLFPRPGT